MIKYGDDGIDEDEVDDGGVVDDEENNDDDDGGDDDDEEDGGVYWISSTSSSSLPTAAQAKCSYSNAVPKYQWILKDNNLKTWKPWKIPTLKHDNFEM